MKKISISISGHRTSITLEHEFIDALRAVARARNKSVSALIAEIDASRKPGVNLSSAIRVFVLNNLKV